MTVISDHASYLHIDCRWFVLQIGPALTTRAPSLHWAWIDRTEAGCRFGRIGSVEFSFERVR